MAGGLILPSHVRPPAGSKYRPAERLRRTTPLREEGKRTLTEMFGGQRDYRPEKPIFLFNAQGMVQTILMPMGQTEVSELDDLIAEHREAKPYDYDQWRADNGLPPREKAGALMAEAVMERVKHHKANPVTDPFRQPNHIDRKPNTLLPERSWQKE
jgi:hypothetical protein